MNAFIDACVSYQRMHFTEHPFWYITVRRPEADVTNHSSQWHVDGFSLRTPHTPEMNYLWCSGDPTFFYEDGIDFPNDFDGTRHNVHRFLSDHIREQHVVRGLSRQVYLLDPYVVHKKPEITSRDRFVVRLSNIPIEIEDDLFTPNPAFLRKTYGRIGKHIAERFEAYGSSADESMTNNCVPLAFA